MMKQNKKLNFKDLKGLTILEIMISLVISSMLIAGTISLYLNSKTTYNTQQSLARLQENGRFALEFIAEDIRASGYVGCPNIHGLQGVKPNDPLAYSANFSNETVVYGASKSSDNSWTTALPITSPAYAFRDDILEDTDVIHVKRGGTCSDYTTTIMPDLRTIQVHASNQCGFEVGETLLISDCEKVDVVRISSIAGGNINIETDSQQQYESNAQVMRFFHRAFYIANNNMDIPSLFRVDQTGNSLEMVEGVAQLKVLYGGWNGNISVDKYLTADQITGWQDIGSIRLALLLMTKEDNVATKPVGYTFNGQLVEAKDVTDRRLRRAYTATVAVRN